MVHRIERIVFFTFLFLLPLQTRIILYQDGPLFNEWRSMFLYVTDGILFALIAFWVVRGSGPRSVAAFARSQWPLILFLGVVALSVSVAEHALLGFYQWIKLFEGAVLFWYARSRVGSFGWRFFTWAFIAGAFAQSSIAVAQFMIQSDLGLVHIEAGPLGIAVPGVAKVVVGGITMIRAYGTFSHSNALAAFLFVGIMGGYLVILTEKEYLARFGRYVPELLSSIVLFVLFLGLGVSFSRTVVFVAVGASVVFVALLFLRASFESYRKRILFLCVVVLGTVIAVVGVLSPFLIERFDIEMGEQSVENRISDIDRGIALIETHPLLGVGPGNYVPYVMKMESDLPFWRYEPIHNVYLLVAVETGLAGLIAFLLFLSTLLGNTWRMYRSHTGELGVVRLVYAILLVCVLLFMVFDHYLWTLQQGRLLFWIVAGIASGLCFTSSKERIH